MYDGRLEADYRVRSSWQEFSHKSNACAWVEEVGSVVGHVWAMNIIGSQGLEGKKGGTRAGGHFSSVLGGKGERSLRGRLWGCFLKVPAC